LYAAVFARSTATGMIGVLLGVYLPALGLDARMLGIVVGAGLAGAAVATAVVTLRGAHWDARWTLLAVTLLAAAGGAGLTFGSRPALLLAAAFIGMVNGMGRDRGAALVVEQALLPAMATDRERTTSFARYHVLQDIGHAVGALLAGAPAWLATAGVASGLAADRVAVWGYVGLSLLPVWFYARLSRTAATGAGLARIALTPASRGILWRIAALFALDGIGGGFLTATLVSYFFHVRFGVGVDVVAPLFVGARILNALSHLGAAWLARRIGLVPTMVWTHLPSSLLLVSMGFAPNFLVAAFLFLVREGLVEMDVPTRQSYVMGVVRPEERTFASGVTHLVRLGAWAVAPFIAGACMQGVSLVAPLILGAALKIAYDLLLWRAFRRLRPPEEAHRAR
jgi:hypothetical protein